MIMNNAQPKSAKEIVSLYLQGERHFSEVEILDNEDFSNTNLEGVTFDKCWLSDMDFRNAQLKGASFRNCNVKCSDFRNADLQNSNFYGSSVEAIYLEGANLEGASFEGAWMYGCELGKGETPAV